MRNVLITGTSSGLGRNLRNVFAYERWATFGTSADGLEVVQGMHTFPWNALHKDGIPRLVHELKEAQPGLMFNVVINNAGINAIRKFEDLDEGFIHDIFQVNCVAPVMLVQALFNESMIATDAMICNVISDAAWRPMRHSLAYNVSKAALDMATKQMARELTKPKQVTIFGVRPGKMVGTGMSHYIDEAVKELRGWSDREAKEYYEQNSLSGKELSPDKVARLIYNLCVSGIPLSGACIDLVG
jgi:3-oxoacyl-[acyl-carrier protein] reductase